MRKIERIRACAGRRGQGSLTPIPVYTSGFILHETRRILVLSRLVRVAETGAYVDFMYSTE